MATVSTDAPMDLAELDWPFGTFDGDGSSLGFDVEGVLQEAGFLWCFLSAFQREEEV